MKKWMLLCVGMTIWMSGCSLHVTENNLLRARAEKADQMMNGKSPEERALEIKTAISRVDGVSTSAVIVEGHTAIIGVRTDAQESKEIGRLTRAVRNAARQTDTEVYAVSVTVNDEIVTQIEEEERSRAQ